MSDIITSLRGMPDGLPKQAMRWRQMQSLWLLIMAQYGYQEVQLPVLEKTALFKRAIGEVTDIVEKEMFTLSDRDGENITLRPEGTAGCVRAGLEHGLLYHQTQKWWYEGPMFRYERPQKGRYRQFTQLGLEAFGFSGVEVEFEQLLLVHRFFKALGIADALVLEVNSLGAQEERKAYRTALIQFWQQHEAEMASEARQRILTNPLRILDSKIPSMQPLIAQAPALSAFLGEASQKAFEQLTALCKAFQLPMRHNPRLVRGLDYYNGLVYEWTTQALGAQGTLCAGGRYDTLVEQLGGKPTPAVGFAIGVERVLLLVEHQNPSLGDMAPLCYVISEGEVNTQVALQLSESWRDAFPMLSLMNHCGGGNVKAQFKKADKSGAQFALIVGDRERASQSVAIKWLRQPEKPQVSIKQKDMFDWFTQQLQQNGEA